MEITSRPRLLWTAALSLLVARLILQIFMPSRLDSDYAQKSGFELVPVDCFNSSLRATGVDIILVHGLGSNPDTTWQKLAKNVSRNHTDPASQGKQFVNWVSDFLCEDFPPEVRRHARVFFYNYDSYWKNDAIEERRSRLGHELFEEVTSMAVKTPERSIIFVGHSYGGLVIKENPKALLKAQHLHSRRLVDILPQTKAIIFLGTPHVGSASISLSVKAAQFFHAFGLAPLPSIVEAITHDSVELQDLHRQFEAISGHVRIVNFHEERETLGFWGLWSDFAVKKQSVTLDRPIAETIDARIGASVYSVPQKTDKLYTERRNLSDRLEEKLNKPLNGSDQVAHAVAISGLGGAGKTQLALRYVERHKLHYDPILWIDARSQEAIRSSFQRCAQDLNLLTETYSTVPNMAALRDDPAVRVVLSWLQNRNHLQDEWLVILDNADDLNNGIRDVIPSGVRGSIILTSRDIECDKVLPPGSQRLQVGTMEPSDAISLLLRHLNLNATEVLEDIHNLAQSICENVQHLALAVHLAGAHIRSSCAKDVNFESDNYSNTYLNPRSCLERYLQHQENHRNQPLQNSTATLTSMLGLASTHMHQGQWKEAEDLFVQVIEPFKRILGADHPGTLNSMNTLASTYMHQGRWKEAEEHLLPVVEARKRLLGLEHPNTLTSMHNLASTYMHQARWKEAEAIFVQVIEPSKGVLGVDHPDTLASMSNLASTYMRQRRWKEAEVLFLQLREARKRVLDVEHPDTLANVGSI
ncbi:P-loop containing nucleoside triphosphate hydrolase [Fusarium oxysporum f. sp. vasinfectum]|nr:P-loop containing nucleoside triphosphate hydrolase [Fusarium oxysporum f. sp. vasinfectum]